MLLHSRLLVLLCLVQACAVNAGSQAPVVVEHQDNAREQQISQLATEIKQLEIQLKKAVADPACTQNSECKSIPVGAKACGGPLYYLIYSTNNTDHEKLTMLADAIKSKQRKHNMLTEATSDCAFLMPPALACIDEQCQQTD